MDLTETEQKYAKAALDVFQRYGVRKTTMEEIAAEAGVSKPTLYGTVRNKDSALALAIYLAKGAAVQLMEENWARAEFLPQKLDIFFEQIVLAGYDMLHASPDASAFETALGDLSRGAIAATRQAEIDAMTRILIPVQGIEESEVGPGDLASFVVTSAMNAKRQAQSREELMVYLNMLKVLTLRALKM